MKITFLGTGSIIPDPKQQNKPFRSYSAIFVELKNGETFLFDIGPGTLTKMHLQGMDTRIHPDNLCISHYHIDHCQDYVAMVKGRRFNPVTGAMEQAKKLNVFGPTHLNAFSEELFSNIERWKYMSTMCNYKTVTDLHELKDVDEVITKNWKLITAPVKHYDGVAYRLEAEGKSFVYSGDMGYDEHLATLGKNADLVAVECSFPTKETCLGAHLSPEDIGKLAKLGNFKQTILTHMYPSCAGREKEMKEKIESLSDTKVTVAEDFMSMEL